MLAKSGPWRDENGSLKAFYHSLVPIIMILFLVAGVIYGIFAGSIKSDKDAAQMAGDQIYHLLNPYSNKAL